MITIAILEDNTYDYALLSDILHNWSRITENDINIFHFTNESIIDACKCQNFDIIFSDIELSTSSKHTGISICEMLRKDGFQNEIIFLTAYSEYVYEGYNVRALNYLVKPVSLEKLAPCMARYLEQHKYRYYCFHDRSHFTPLPYNNIICFTKEGHNVAIQTVDTTYYERCTINEIKTKLPPSFIQCHKSCIVNLKHVLSITGNEAHLSDGNIKTIGRSFLPSIRSAMLDLSHLL